MKTQLIDKKCNFTMNLFLFVLLTTFLISCSNPKIKFENAKIEFSQENYSKALEFFNDLKNSDYYSGKKVREIDSLIVLCKVNPKLTELQEAMKIKNFPKAQAINLELKQELESLSNDFTQDAWFQFYFWNGEFSRKNDGYEEAFENYELANKFQNSYYNNHLRRFSLTFTALEKFKEGKIDEAENDMRNAIKLETHQELFDFIEKKETLEFVSQSFKAYRKGDFETALNKMQSYLNSETESNKTEIYTAYRDYLLYKVFELKAKK